jgi:hypothetical protein
VSEVEGDSDVDGFEEESEDNPEDPFFSDEEVCSVSRLWRVLDVPGYC